MIRKVVFFLFLSFALNWDVRAISPRDRPPEGSSLKTQGEEFPLVDSAEIQISAGPGSVLEGDILHLKEYVDIRYGDLRLQADSVRLNLVTKECHAEGNVILDSSDLRITARSAEINLNTGLGIFFDALVQAESSMVITARKMERIAVDRFLIEKGTFTTCTQPTPKWSFHVGKGLIHIDHYAYLHNLSFRINGIPAFYSPFLVWPIKEDRATGFLIPQIGYSQSRGSVINTSFFWAMRRNMDATFSLDIFGKERVGTGLEYRFIPNPAGSGRFSGYYQRERKTDESRWFAGFRQQQSFSSRSRLLANINQVSDRNYYLNFERDLGIGTSPSALSTIFATWNGSVHSLNLRTERREQFSSTGDLEQAILPEIELRGRTRPLGKSSIRFSFESSVDNFRKETPTFDATYQRVDFFPRFSAPLHPAAWLQIEPSLSLRDTFYSKSLSGGAISDENLNRTFLDARLDVIGPRFSRTFSGRSGKFASQYQNTWEPRLTYQYVTRSEDPLAPIPFDEIDTLRGDRNLLNYSLTTRLFAKRPGKEGSGSLSHVQEVSSLSLSQAVSFSDPLSVSASLVDESRFSPVRISYRLNPTVNTSLNFNTSYDVLFRKLSSASLSTTLRKADFGFLDLSWFQQKFLDAGTETNQVRLLSEGRFFQKRFLLGIQISYDVERDQIQNQRYRIGYNTQCCGFQLELFEREFLGVDEQEIRFMVNLKGVGTVVDFQSGSGIGPPILY